jgi:hypothetical protein
MAAAGVFSLVLGGLWGSPLVLRLVQP